MATGSTAAATPLTAGRDPYALAAEAADALAAATGVEAHDVAVVLGSGWAPTLDYLGATVAETDLSGLPGFSAPVVAGHRDIARSIEIDGRVVLALAGRSHLYEGHSAAHVVHGVRVAAASGCRAAVLTNAAGAVNPDFAVGQPVVIADHLNLTGQSPMVGAPPPSVPDRFCDLTNAYSPRLRQIAAAVDPTLVEGVYAGLLGGNYETPAEIRMLAMIGADLVGMSTVLETIAARHLGLEVLGISLVTNMAAGVAAAPLTHTEVIAAGEDARDRLAEVIGGVLGNLWRTPA